MITLNVFILSIYLAVSHLDAAEPLKITFQDLDRVNSPQEIIIRGFLYQAPDGRWVLAAESNLRSCCVGATHKASSQLQLKGSFDRQKTNQVITVRGTLQQQDRHYILSDVQEMPSGSSQHWIIYIILGCTGLWGLWKISKK